MDKLGIGPDMAIFIAAGQEMMELETNQFQRGGFNLSDRTNYPKVWRTGSRPTTLWPCEQPFWVTRACDGHVAVGCIVNDRSEHMHKGTLVKAIPPVLLPPKNGIPVTWSLRCQRFRQGLEVGR